MKDGILLHASLAPRTPPRWTGALLAALPYAKRLQVERQRAAARDATLAGIALALAGAARAEPLEVVRVGDMRYRDDAKPRFAQGPGFSISHAAGRVACVVCRDADPGIDLESLAPADAAATARLCRWTATEAALKAAGLGLRHADAVRLDLEHRRAEVAGRQYVLQALALAPDTVGHVAAAVTLALAIEEVALDGAEVSAAVERGLRLAPQR